jgi:hypothetical protein
MSDAFQLPDYHPPAFGEPPLSNAPLVRTEAAPADGIVPEEFHATTNLPEYIHTAPAQWVLVPESRMDAVIVLTGEGPRVVEPREVRRGDAVVIGRGEDGEDGIYVHTDGFVTSANDSDKWRFNERQTRESPYSLDYDSLYELLRWERDCRGHIVWVLGPAVVFDRDSRDAMASLVRGGFCQAVLAGNALATHDLEAALYGTGLGREIYRQRLQTRGHYNHLDVLNRARQYGSLEAATSALGVTDGVVAACAESSVPLVLAGSIRDDGPLPGVIGYCCESQRAMREHARRATTAIAVATQLHAIAFGNMLPTYQVNERGVRPVYFYVVDISEFAVDKLANRGSMQVRGITTNAQDFVVNVARALSGT